MASRIDIVTEDLEQYTRMAQEANNAIAAAAQLLNSITVHTDWECPQRDAIVEDTQRNRADSNRLQENAESYYREILAASEAFKAAEDGLNQKINGVEELISRFLSLVPGSGSSGGGGGHSFGRSNTGGLHFPGNGGLKQIAVKIGQAAVEKTRNFGNTVSFSDLRSQLGTGFRNLK